MAADLTEINAIVKHRYQTGAYGNAHLKMPRPLWDDVCATAPTPKPEPAWWPGGLDALFGIPIVVDDTLPPGMWRLVDNTTREILQEGKA